MGTGTGGFTVKDSGERESFDSGMVRDTESGKTDYTLVYDGPMLDRWAEHLTKGARKYAARNWMKATGEVELERFGRSAVRHFRQWMRGDADEDHAAAVLFNLNGAEYVKERLASGAGQTAVEHLGNAEYDRVMGAKVVELKRGIEDVRLRHEAEVASAMARRDEAERTGRADYRPERSAEAAT